MEKTSVLLLTVSVLCSTLRAVFSKKLGIFSENRHKFYVMQTLMFSVATLMIFAMNIREIRMPSALTVLWAALY